jgi:hypothetical protein
MITDFRQAFGQSFHNYVYLDKCNCELYFRERYELCSDFEVYRLMNIFWSKQYF